MTVIVYALFAAPFALCAYMAASGDVPWYAAAGIGYGITMFLVWCFANDD